MMQYTKLLVITVLFCCFKHELSAQMVRLIAETGLDLDFREYFLSDGQRQYYLTPEGDRLLVNTDLRYVIIDPQNGKEIASGEHIGKFNNITRATGTLPSIMQFDEGSAYFVFEDKQQVLFLDWNGGKNVVKLVDLQNGEVLWEKTDYKITASLGKQMAGNFLGVTTNPGLEAEFTSPQFVADVTDFIGANLSLTNSASFIAQGLILRLPDLGLFILRTAEGLVGVSEDTGAKLWDFTSEKINVGEILQIPGTNDILFINNYLNAVTPFGTKPSSAQSWMARIAGKTGKQLWRTNYEPPFNAMRIYFYDDKFCTDFDNVVCRNLSDGEQTFKSPDDFKNGPLMKKAQNDLQARLKFRRPSLFDGSLLYETSYQIKGVQVGGSKTKVQKYEMEADKALWATDWLDKNSELYFLSDNKVLLERSSGIAKTNLIGIDASSGKPLFTTEEIKHYLFRNGAGALFTDEAIYISGKKETVVYDADSFEVIQRFDTKAADIGKLQAMFGTNNQVGYIADKGMAFFNKAGEVTYREETDRVEAAFWNSNATFLLNRNKINIIDNRSLTSFETLKIPFNVRTLYFFNSTAELFAIIDPITEAIKIYKISY